MMERAARRRTGPVLFLILCVLFLSACQTAEGMKAPEESPEVIVPSMVPLPAPEGIRIAVASDLHLDPDHATRSGELSGVSLNPELVEALLRDARHQGAELIYSHLENVTMEGTNLPMLSYSTSVKDGKLLTTVANCSLKEEARITLSSADAKLSTVSARILTGEVHAHNDFGHAEDVVIRDLPAEIVDGKVCVTLPSCSVAEICMK